MCAKMGAPASAGALRPGDGWCSVRRWEVRRGSSHNRAGPPRTCRQGQRRGCCSGSLPSRPSIKWQQQCWQSAGGSHSQAGHLHTPLGPLGGPRGRGGRGSGRGGRCLQARREQGAAPLDPAAAATCPAPGQPFTKSSKGERGPADCRQRAAPRPRKHPSRTAPRARAAAHLGGRRGRRRRGLLLRGRGGGRRRRGGRRGGRLGGRGRLCRLSALLHRAERLPHRHAVPLSKHHLREHRAPGRRARIPPAANALR